jgi:hypothetical protein
MICGAIRTHVSQSLLEPVFTVISTITYDVYNLTMSTILRCLAASLYVLHILSGRHGHPPRTVNPDLITCLSTCAVLTITSAYIVIVHPAPCLHIYRASILPVIYTHILQCSINVTLGTIHDNDCTILASRTHPCLLPQLTYGKKHIAI